MNNKTAVLIFVTLIIVGSIWFLESKKTMVSNVPVEHLATATVSKNLPPAIELVPGGGFINADPFTLKSLIGKKVILIDFWTYSCINCLRTLPYLKGWYEKYKDQGLVIIGVHTPEFDFEKNLANVTKAVKDLGITYPVMQDNDYATWNAYKNQYWPREYLIDINGYIVHDHAGEGQYDETEKAIQDALKERAQVLGIQMPDVEATGTLNPTSAVTVDSTQLGSPETYFGAMRNDYLGNGSKGISGAQTLKVPSVLAPNTLYLGGTWNFADQYAENQNSNAEIDFDYKAKNVYFVGASVSGINVDVYVDGMKVGTTNVKDNKLYHVVSGTSYGTHTLKLIIEKAGLQAFTFTFG